MWVGIGDNHHLAISTHPLHGSATRYGDTDKAQERELGKPYVLGSSHESLGSINPNLRVALAELGTKARSSDYRRVISNLGTNWIPLICIYITHLNSKSGDARHNPHCSARGRHTRSGCRALTDREDNL